MYVSECIATAPDEYKTPLQEMTYRTLGELGIPFVRVDTDEAITMEDCRLISQRLGVEVVKTIFLSTRNGKRLFLFVTTAEKPFNTKQFGAALEVPRVSFASPELMQAMLGTKVGAATVFSAMLDSAKEVTVAIDRDVAEREWYGCSDGTTTGYMKVGTERILNAFLPHAGHKPAIIDI